MLADNRLLTTTATNDDDDDGATILDDGLSDDDEENPSTTLRLTSSQAAARRHDAKQYKCFTLFLLFFTFLISIIVGAVRSFGNNNPRLSHSKKEGWEGEEWGNGLTEKENDERLTRTLEYLREKDVSDPATLNDETTYGVFGVSYSPQYRAALWLAKYDQYRIKIPDAYASDPSSSFVQRYTLAVLFLSTGGLEQWMWKVNFLRGWHECGWYDTFTIQGYSEDFVFGVLCDGQPDYSDVNEMDGWGGTRTVTGISLPRKFSCRDDFAIHHGT